MTDIPQDPNTEVGKIVKPVYLPDPTINSEVRKRLEQTLVKSFGVGRPNYTAVLSVMLDWLMDEIAQEANKAQLAIIDRLAKELEGEQSIEVNKDDIGVTYYYTIKSVEWAIERIKNQVTADKEQA